MIDRLFTALLAFTLLAGGTAAVGSALLDLRPGSMPAQSVAKRLPSVEMDVRRTANAPIARLAATVSEAERRTP